MSEIVLTLDTHRLDALEEVMQEQGGVEKYMQNLLIDLYSEQVPLEKQKEVDAQIEVERNPPFLEGTRALRPGDIVFTGPVLRWENLLNFRCQPTASLCEALGVSDNIEETGALAGACVNFNLAANRPEDTLLVTLTADNGGITERRYRFSTEELTMLQTGIEAYCKEKPGRSLAEYTRRYEAETAKAERQNDNAVSSEKHHRKRRQVR